MKKILPAVAIIAVVLSGCDPVSERDCGVFDHPELALWQSDAIAGQALFMSDDGSSVDFRRQDIVLNEAFLGTDGASNDEDVICELTATVRLQATDDSVAISSIYIQRERLLLDSADEALLIDHRVEAPSGTELPGGYLADISVASTRVNFDPTRIEYLVPDETTEGTGDDMSEDQVLSAEIGGQSYDDVVRISPLIAAPDPENPDTQTVTGIRQIVIARQFGVVAFTDDRDREFVRVPTE